MSIKELREGKDAVGTMIRLVRNPAVITIAKNAGLDFVMFDMEHSNYSFETISDAATLARATKLDCFVRVPELAKSYVSRAFDCGVSGVMVPMIRNGEDARRFAGWAKYPPLGVRGFGSNSAHTEYRNVNGNSAQFMEEENERTLAIAQIELKEAIEEIDEIAATPGIDACLVGPADLSNSMGMPGDFMNPCMVDAIKKVSEACKKHGKIFGFHTNAKLLEYWMPYGLKLKMCSMDINWLSNGMQTIVDLKEKK
ncbi:MAG: aldolase/citrate lyase family protein [Spirochaetia bacterium]|jgi:2-keto-3-deoxy-L-rhamnonate aldolase RhmA|nr:aldolase/citrate lyase family protein [Spirochaetia bacterium]